MQIEPIFGGFGRRQWRIDGGRTERPDRIGHCTATSEETVHMQVLQPTVYEIVQSADPRTDAYR